MLGVNFVLKAPSSQDMFQAGSEAGEGEGEGEGAAACSWTDGCERTERCKDGVER